MAPRKHLIIGAGTAALAAARKIRSLCPADEITLITKEDCPPYCVAVLPYLISGRIKESDLWLMEEGQLRELRFSLARGREVTGINPDNKQVRYHTGETETYDTLLIASGSHPVKPDIKGLDAVDFLPFHTLSDFSSLQQRLSGTGDITIYGGGLVALELIIALLEAGYRASLIVRSRVLRQYFDPEASGMIRDILSGKGARFYEGSTIEEVHGEKNNIELDLSDGTSLNTDLLAISLGVKPSVAFLENSGIAVRDGILVDRAMRTNIADIYAAGDVAEAPDFFTATPGLSPILPSAIDQGKIAGSTMAGEEAVYDGWVPMNILHFFGHRAFSMGRAADHDTRVLQTGGEGKKGFKKLVFQGDTLVGASFVDVDLFPGVFQYLIRNRVPVGAHAELLFDKPKETSSWLMLKTEKEESMSLEE